MMTPWRNEPQLLMEEELIKGKKFSFTIRRWVNNHEERQYSSTPGYTPTTISPRLIRSRPQVYKANAILRNKSLKGFKLVAIKVVELSNLDKLKIEYNALKKLSRSLKPIAPKIIDKISFLPEKKLAFFVYEWFDEEEWMTLAQILEQDMPLYKNDILHQNIAFQSLSKTLNSVIERTHKLGVIHGDLKPEHVLVRKKNKKLDFRDVRLIDFGLSYTKHLSHWRGGTNGFSNPYYWNEYQQELYSWYDLKSVDFFGIRAMLYYVYTGEVYPATTPAFRYLSTPRKSNQMANLYKQLNESILSRFYSADPPKEFLDVLDRLGQPDEFFETKTNKSSINKLFNFPSENYFLIFWLLSLFLMTLKSQDNVINAIGIILIGIATYIGIIMIKSSNIISKAARILFPLFAGGLIVSWMPMLSPIGWVVMLWGTIASILLTIIRFLQPKKEALPLEIGSLVGIIIPFFTTFSATIFIPLTLGILLKNKESLTRIGLVFFSAIWTWYYFHFLISPADHITSVRSENILSFFIQILIWIGIAEIASRVLNSKEFTSVKIFGLSLLGFLLMVGQPLLTELTKGFNFFLGFKFDVNFFLNIIISLILWGLILIYQNNKNRNNYEYPSTISEW